MGTEMADDLIKDIAAWEANQPTIFNNAPTDLARDELARTLQVELEQSRVMA